MKKKKKGVFCPNYPLSLADTDNWSRIFLRKPHFSVTKGIQFHLTKLPAAAFRSGYYLQLMPGNMPLIPSVSFLVTWSKTYPIYLQKRRESNSVQFSHSVMSNSLWSHGLQHARLPCPSPTPRACSNLCPLSQSCPPTISSSVVPFSSCLQSFSAK